MFKKKEWYRNARYLFSDGFVSINFIFFSNLYKLFIFFKVSKKMFGHYSLPYCIQ